MKHGRKRFVLLIALLAVVTGGSAYHFHSQQPARLSSLVSIGDSVTAGAGLTSVRQPTATDDACGRAQQAYPAVLSQRLDMPLKQFACSGAKTTTGLLQSQTAGTMQLPAQLEQAAGSIADNTVVVTIGANDVGWSDLLLRCAQTTCTGNAAIMSQYQASLQQLGPNLDKVFRSIASHHPRQIIVNTYYTILSDTGTCYESQGITPQKISWVNARQQELADLISQAARGVGATVVTPDFSGHQLCDAEPWVQGPFDPAPLHPTAAGQQQIARQDQAVIRAK